MSMLCDDNPRKVKGMLTDDCCQLLSTCPSEKSSWLNLARGQTTTSDQWRQATCRLTEEEEGCVLNVYLEVGSPL